MNTRLFLIVALLSFLPPSHAGVIEELLARPGIQALLSRADLSVITQRCSDAAYRQKNLAACQQMEEASRLAKIPPEVRSLMASPAASASIRELCLAAQVTPARNTYLCRELTNADRDFAAMAKNADTARQQADIQDRQLGR